MVMRTDWLELAIVIVLFLLVWGAFVRFPAYTVDMPPQINVALQSQRGAPSSEPISTIITRIATEYVFPSDTLINLAYCESTLDPTAISTDGKYYGLYQIDIKLHPEVSKQSAFDPEYSTIWTINSLRAGQSSMWPNCYKNI